MDRCINESCGTCSRLAFEVHVIRNIRDQQCLLLVHGSFLPYLYPSSKLALARTLVESSPSKDDMCLTLV